MKYLFMIVGCLALAACGGNLKVLGGYGIDMQNPQAQAGLNTTTLIWGKVENSGGEEYQLKHLSLINGQESGTLSLEIALSDGTIYKFNGGDIKAFEAFTTRGDVEKAIAAELGAAATPEMVGKLADLFGGGVIP